MGTLDLAEKIAESEQFYTTLGNQAKTHGICISVISLPGEECNLDHLGKLADNTGRFNLPLLL